MAERCRKFGVSSATPCKLKADFSSVEVAESRKKAHEKGRTAVELAAGRRQLYSEEKLAVCRRGRKPACDSGVRPKSRFGRTAASETSFSKRPATPFPRSATPGRCWSVAAHLQQAAAALEARMADAACLR